MSANSGKSTCRSSTAPRGLTLVEVLIVIAIMGVLLSLLIPAVMDSNRSAQRLACANNLKQIELATLSYHEAYNEYPSYFRSGSIVRQARIQPSRYFSIFGRIAPYLEQVAIYNQINFQVGLMDNLVVGDGSPWELSFASPSNTTVMTCAIPAFFCPSDPAPISRSVCVGTNYRANFGVGPDYGADRNLSGPFTLWTSTSAKDVTDGLSQTASYSEKPRGDLNRRSFNSFVDPLIEPRDPDPPATTLFEYCTRQPIVPENYRTTTGTNWLVGSLNQTCYNHMEVPNGKVPDCVRLGFMPGRARATARSYHGLGANVAMADGSVRFVMTTISLRTWEAVGTRGGNEVISEESW